MVKGVRSCPYQVCSDRGPELLRYALIVHAASEDLSVLKICTAACNTSVHYEWCCGYIVEVIVDKQTGVRHVSSPGPEAVKEFLLDRGRGRYARIKLDYSSCWVVCKAVRSGLFEIVCPRVLSCKAHKDLYATRTSLQLSHSEVALCCRRSDHRSSPRIDL
jgi:hypothetical protein